MDKNLCVFHICLCFEISFMVGFSLYRLGTFSLWQLFVLSEGRLRTTYLVVDTFFINYHIVVYKII